MSFAGVWIFEIYVNLGVTHVKSSALHRRPAAVEWFPKSAPAIRIRLHILYNITHVSFSLCHDQLQAAVPRAQFINNMKRIICIIYLHISYLRLFKEGAARFKNFPNDWFSPSLFDLTLEIQNQCLGILRSTHFKRCSTMYGGWTPTPNRLCAAIPAFRVHITGMFKLEYLKWWPNGGVW